MTESENRMAQFLFSIGGKMAFRKTGKVYMIYCFMCSSYEEVSKEKWQQIRAAKVCPNCGREIMISNLREAEKSGFVMDGSFGYWIKTSWMFGEHPKVDAARLVADWSGKRLKVLGIVKTMGCSLSFDGKTEWRTVRSDNTYHYCFYSRCEVPKRTLKDYYMELDLPFKSNQITLIKNGIYNHNQMRYIYWFDLKTKEEIKRYSGYMKNNPIGSMRDWEEMLNIYFLDYLSRNKIRIADFIDYINDCRKLRIKPQKPKDFQEEHMRVNSLIEINKNEKYSENVIERQKELIENEAKIGNAEFRTFSSVADIVFVGKVLNNCIARTYTHLYADGKCDLYYVKQEGRIIIAIEVREKRIIQAREYNNKEATKDNAKLVKKWAKAKGFAYGV